MDWSSLYKFVVTGSLDRRVIMWNPFSQKPLAVLSGHNAAVTGVVVNDRDNQIISLSTDHIIKVGRGGRAEGEEEEEGGEEGERRDRRGGLAWRGVRNTCRMASCGRQQQPCTLLTLTLAST